MSFCKTVELRVVDKAKALAWFAANPMFAEVVEFNEARLKAMEKSLGEAFAVPGIEVTRDLGAASSRAA